MIHTPCIGHCKAPHGICIGCLRTRREIGLWRDLSSQQQLDTIHALRPESGTHLCPSCKQPAQCDIANGKSHCWCFDVEPVAAVPTDNQAQCLCRACLSNAQR
uniref:cysteine-rich CWC family protein n=1 Tax=Thaumasiovibrio occultus TaxID=1891184 RepID=UPI000B34D787|nr:cysteine-rich CWC family protein [Thaumasiovibrio occultus]